MFACVCVRVCMYACVYVGDVYVCCMCVSVYKCQIPVNNTRAHTHTQIHTHNRRKSMIIKELVIKFLFEFLGMRIKHYLQHLQSD